MNEYYNNNNYRDHDRAYCYFHPKEVIVGVCALCLNERLLVLASKQAQKRRNSHKKTFSFTNANLPKIFALNTLLHRLDIGHQQQQEERKKSLDYYTSSSSPEDSFISIKFEENGVASWDKKGKIAHDHEGKKKANKKIKCVVEHARPPRGSLRWRKRIGHLVQLIRWKRSSKGNVCHVGTKLEGANKVRYGWIRTLTKRKTKE